MKLNNLLKIVSVTGEQFQIQTIGFEEDIDYNFFSRAIENRIYLFKINKLILNKTLTPLIKLINLDLPKKGKRS